jgi:hypothetical protein
MFHISPEAMRAFESNARRDYEDRVIDRLTDAFPEAIVLTPPDRLRARVAGAIDRALGYGITREADVAMFIDFTFELGETFDTDPRYEWARAVLLEEAFDGRQKVAAIRHELDRFDG